MSGAITSFSVAAKDLTELVSELGAIVPAATVRRLAAEQQIVFGEQPVTLAVPADAFALESTISQRALPLGPCPEPGGEVGVRLQRRPVLGRRATSTHGPTAPSPTRSPAARELEAKSLAGILTEIDAQVAAGKTPVLVVDLDDTLRVTAKRATLAARITGIRNNVAALASFVFRGENQSSLTKLVAQEVPDKTRLRALGGEFAALYDGFAATGSHDAWMPGAAEFLSEAHRRGARLVYRTGSPAALSEPTRSLFAAAGFPTTEDCVWMMRPAGVFDVGAFKRSCAAEIRGLGAVVASFDNDPANCQIDAEEFGTARRVLLDYYGREPAAPEGIQVLRDFSAWP